MEFLPAANQLVLCLAAFMLYRCTVATETRNTNAGFYLHGLLDQLRERLRYLHYSLETEQNYVYWVRWFIRWHGLRHPKDMSGKEVEAFLAMLANERKVAPSTHRQALSALLLLYKEVLDLELPWMQEIGRPLPTKRSPVARRQGDHWLRQARTVRSSSASGLPSIVRRQARNSRRRIPGEEEVMLV
jgi:Phage integrase, N-terminal SAM-like domain